MAGSIRLTGRKDVPTFLLGAGFNVDTGRLRTPHNTECSYPLAADTARLCFNLSPSEIPPNKSIEDLFDDAQNRHDNNPMKLLTDMLMDADYYVASKLASPNTRNSYIDFFDSFPQANFLTFNYDSLVELFLFRLARWYPEDGYGLPVLTEVFSEAIQRGCRKSSSKVVHLHGSLCVRASEFEINPSDGRQFASLEILEEPTPF